MTGSNSPTPTLSVPSTTIRELRRALGGADGLGPDRTGRAFHAAGAAVGTAVVGQFVETVGGDPSGVDEVAFWTNLDEYLASRGWGTVDHERIHPGLGALRSSDWCECDASGEEGALTGWFGSGLLSTLFSAIAGRPISVLETSCRSRGDSTCSFAFGSENAVEQLQLLLQEHPRLEDALAHL